MKRLIKALTSVAAIAVVAYTTYILTMMYAAMHDCHDDYTKSKERVYALSAEYKNAIFTECVRLIKNSDIGNVDSINLLEHHRNVSSLLLHLSPKEVTLYKDFIFIEVASCFDSSIQLWISKSKNGAWEAKLDDLDKPGVTEIIWEMKGEPGGGAQCD